MAISLQKQSDIVRSYVKEKLSVMQIANRIGLSCSGIRHYLDKNNIKRRSISEAIRCCYITRFDKVPFQIKRRLTPEEEQLKIAGIMIYWGEGTKGGGCVTLSNSDPQVVKVFLRFLRDICGIDEKRLRVLLHIYPDLNKDKLKTFWSKVTDIPKSQFLKTYIHEGKKGTYKKKSQYGTISLRYSDKKLLGQILNWIREYVNRWTMPG